MIGLAARAGSPVLAALTGLRRVLHAAGVLPTAWLPAPVISVGNLAAGGTGKTPLVEHLARALSAAGARPVVLSRGYGPRVRGSVLNDEGLVLARNLPGLAQRQDPDRARAGRAALAAGEGDCLLLDDGFQHFALGRDLDVVALDARAPFSGGLRREGPGALARAGAVVLTRCDGVEGAALAALRAEIARLAPGAAVALSRHGPRDVWPLRGGDPQPVESLRGRTVYAAAGIARPESFVATLESMGARVAGLRRFRDHRLAGLDLLRGAFEEARRLGADCVVVTQKDAVKLAASPGDPPLPVLAVRVAIEILEGGDALERAVADALAAGRRRAAEAP